jgi:polyisoprenoid-binding protein YceI
VKLLAAAGLVAVATSAAAAPEAYTLDSRHTFPAFQVRHLGISLQFGRFNKTTGKVVIDREARSGTADITIDAASIDMGIDKWDEAMRGEEWFNVAQFPAMTFKAPTVLFEGEKVAGAVGEFTLLGVTRPLTLKLDGFNCIAHPLNKKTVCGGTATATIKRSEFGLTKGLPGIGDDIMLTIPVEAFKD